MTTNASEIPVHAPRNNRRRAIVSSVLGNSFEWFDFVMYGMFATTIGRIYFPSHDKTISLLLSLAVFGVAFVARPLGGVVFGLYADLRGRKAALSAVILLMAAGTGIIGILPGYKAIGLFAPVVLVLARLLQGFSAGGEFSSGTTMLIEYFPDRLRGFFGSFQMCSAALAYLVGNALIYVIEQVLTPHQVDTWGWRIPFLLGVLIGPVGAYIRERLGESPEFEAIHPPREKQSSWSLLRLALTERRALVTTFCLTVTGTVSSYLILIYLPMFAITELRINPTIAHAGAFIGAAILLFGCPVAGYLSDQLGSKAVLLPAVGAYIVLCGVSLPLLVLHPSQAMYLGAELAICFTMSFIWGPFPSVLARAFPANVRATGMAISYNVAVMLFGGLAPFYSTLLIRLTGNPAAPTVYLVATGAIGFVGVLIMKSPERSRQPVVFGEYVKILAQPNWERQRAQTLDEAQKKQAPARSFEK